GSSSAGGCEDRSVPWLRSCRTSSARSGKWATTPAARVGWWPRETTFPQANCVPPSPPGRPGAVSALPVKHSGVGKSREECEAVWAGCQDDRRRGERCRGLGAPPAPLGMGAHSVPDRRGDVGRSSCLFEQEANGQIWVARCFPSTSDLWKVTT